MLPLRPESGGGRAAPPDYMSGAFRKGGHILALRLTPVIIERRESGADVLHNSNNLSQHEI